MDFINLNYTNELPKDILSKINKKDIELEINFDDIKCINQVNIFLNQNKSIKNYYLMNNYKISIDLIDYDYKIYLWLIDCIEIASNKIENSKQYIKLFENPSKWNISICENIMFNFPFTLLDIIYLPISYIKLCYSTNDTNRFINTLIHEKIHLGQRAKELEWENFIVSNSKNWIKIKSNTKEFNLIEQFISNNLNNDNNFISNPDTYYSDFKYIYLDNDKYYYGQYIWNEKTQHIEKKYFELDMKDKIFKPTTKKLEEEHPYEIYAYKIADNLIK